MEVGDVGHLGIRVELLLCPVTMVNVLETEVRQHCD